MKKTVLAATTAIASGFMSGAVHANEWEYTVAPYVWGPEFRTSLDVGPNPPVDGNTSIFNILKGAFMIAGEARNGRWTIGGEFNYLNLGDDVSFGPFSSAASWDLKGTMVSLGVNYAVFEDDHSRFDALAGVRHWDLDLSTTVFGLSAETDQNWTDPLIGARYSRTITDRWNVTAMGNVGGFDYGSHFQWEAVLQANWKWTDRVNVAGGYRHLSVDFKEGRDVIDLILTGPYVALAFNF
ncbi:TonB-dependent receptor [Ruegeria halocynthiae]|uniref:TonB-dependent receptor n=1 Tax=Ruegeria halocynthiae TaxID=985054 RepID=UPI0006919A00|nr:TonB-dependent receptor [Ruegeria halocynthiae]